MAVHAPTGPADEAGDVEEPSFFAEINITPLTDVVLVLLIIFMVSSSAMVEAMRAGMIDVTLPTASTATKEPIADDAFIVGITADGRIYVHGEVVDETKLLELLTAARQAKPNTMIVVQADGALKHRRVVDVIDLLRKSGFTNVGIAAETPAQP